MPSATRGTSSFGPPSYRHAHMYEKGPIMLCRTWRMQRNRERRTQSRKEGGKWERKVLLHATTDMVQWTPEVTTLVLGGHLLSPSILRGSVATGARRFWRL